MAYARDRAVLFVLSSLVLFASAPIAQAQSTSIGKVLHPDTLVLPEAESATIVTDVYYENARRGYVLAVTLLDPAGVFGLLKIGKGSPLSCIEPSGLEWIRVAMQKEMRGICIVKLGADSGMERVEFRLDKLDLVVRLLEYGPGPWRLVIGAAIADLGNNLIENSLSLHEFQMELAVPVPLEVLVPPSVEVTVDGQRWPAGPVRTKLLSGEHTISVPETVELNKTTRLRFKGWSDGETYATRSVMLPPDFPRKLNATLQALYVTQYYLTLLSPQASAMGGGWYDEGSTAAFSVSECSQCASVGGILGTFGSKWVFKGWFEGEQLVDSSTNGSLRIDRPHILEARWQVDHTVPILIAVISAAVSSGIAYTLNRAWKSRTEDKRILPPSQSS